MPKSGKHANNQIRFEDQPMPQQRASRMAGAKNNPLDTDYIAGKYTNSLYELSLMLSFRRGSFCYSGHKFQSCNAWYQPQLEQEKPRQCGISWQV